jgi:D-lactate dehydrogenase
MKIVFVEVEEWEKEELSKAFPDARQTHDKITEENVKDFADTEVMCTFITSTLNEKVLSSLPNLKLIVTRSTGFDHINLDYTKAHNIAVSNVPEYGSHTVAEHAFALILALSRKIHKSIKQVHEMEFDHQNLTGFDLNGKTLGIVGLGKIGMNVLHIAKGFGMNVVVQAHHPDEELAKKEGYTNVDLDTLLGSSDVITLHVPYTKATHHLINTDNYTKIKKGALLINTARGGLIDTQSLVQGLQEGIVGGVGLDVLEGETQLAEEAEILCSHTQTQTIDMRTLLMDHVLLYHPNVVITPHNAFNSKEAILNILHTTIENIKSFEGGSAINTVEAAPSH